MNDNEAIIDNGVATDFEAPATAEIVLADEASKMLDAFTAQTAEGVALFGFDADTEEGVKRVFNAQEDGESLAESELETVTLDGIILSPGTRVDPVSGSRTACVTTTLLSSDGHNYVSQSNGIARTAARIINLYTRLGWPEGGITVRVTEQKLAGGRTYKRLVLA